MKRLFFIGLFAIFCIFNSNAQVSDTSGREGQTESVKSSKNTFFTVFRGNPGKAALYSLILPGAGQLYNGQWWKVPLVYGVEGGLFAYALWNTNKFKEFSIGYQQMLDGDILIFKGITQASQVRLFRNRYQRQKDFAWVYFTISHLLNVVDAFVSRHLKEFDIDENLSFKISVPEYNNYSFQGIYTGIGVAFIFGN